MKYSIITVLKYIRRGIVGKAIAIFNQKGRDSWSKLKQKMRKNK